MIIYLDSPVITSTLLWGNSTDRWRPSGCRKSINTCRI